MYSKCGVLRFLKNRGIRMSAAVELNRIKKSFFKQNILLNGKGRRAFAATAVFGATCFLFIAGVAVRDLKSGDPTQLHRGGQPPGAFRTAGSKNAPLVEALESDPAAPLSKIQLLSRIYRTQGSQGLTIQRALEKKTSDTQAKFVLVAFAPDKVRLPELFPLPFAWLDRRSDAKECGRTRDVGIFSPKRCSSPGKSRRSWTSDRAAGVASRFCAPKSFASQSSSRQWLGTWIASIPR